MEEAIQQYKDKGVNVHVLTGEELAAFKKAMVPVHEWWLSNVPEGKKYIDFVAEHH